MWSLKDNQYLVVESTTAHLVHKLSRGMSIEAISQDLAQQMSLPIKESIHFVTDLKNRFIDSQPSTISTTLEGSGDVIIPGNFLVQKFYKINKLVIKASFESEEACFLIHPKFEHLEVASQKHDFCFKTFTHNARIFLAVEDQLIGSWPFDEIHYFQGKFSMQLIQKIHDMQEDKWLGVFHASAVSNKKSAMLFLGDSGNGKSTSLALLQAHGFDCIADDFVPVAAHNQDIYSFPAAISVKKSSLATLLALYPELDDSKEYDFKTTQKIVRYLKPNNNDFSSHVPCKGLVFIKYTKDAPLSCKKITKVAAFQKLVPDSWLSPLQENAAIFLDWFAALDCYELTYSNNKEMVAQVSKLFKDEL
ncbi:hypothetical protein N9428_01125 [Flavobacteriaceae bacterium]|nr:hypothetical protein [Flavobacteriaceae bacterium]